jgi:hypothetical protein
MFLEGMYVGGAGRLQGANGVPGSVRHTALLTHGSALLTYDSALLKHDTALLKHC